MNSSNSLRSNVPTPQRPPFRTVNPSSYIHKRSSLILNSSSKQNLSSRNQKSILQNLSTNRFQESMLHRHIFDIPSDHMINYDEELKQYILGKKVFEQKDVNVLDFADTPKPSKTQLNFHKVQTQTTPVKQVPKLPKHQRIKSRSQLSPHEYACSTPFQLIKFDSSYRGKQFHIPLIRKKSIKQNLNPKNGLSEEKRTFSKHRKSIKFWQVRQDPVKQEELKSLEMQLIVKRANEKRQQIIKEIIKKLHLPILNAPKPLNSLRALVESVPRKKQIQSEHRPKKAAVPMKSGQLVIGKIDGVAKLKIPETKNKNAIKRVDKEVYLNRIKFNQIKDRQASSRSKHLHTQQNEKLKKFRLFAKGI